MATFRFNDVVDLRMVDELADHWRCSRTEAIRRAVHEVRQTVGVYEKARLAFVERLIDRHGENALLELTLDPTYENSVTAHIDGKPTDLFLDATVDPRNDELGRHAGVDGTNILAIGDPDSDVRIMVGRVPAIDLADDQAPFIVDGARLGLLLAALRDLRSNDVDDVPGGSYRELILPSRLTPKVRANMLVDLLAGTGARAFVTVPGEKAEKILLVGEDGD